MMLNLSYILNLVPYIEKDRSFCLKLPEDSYNRKVGLLTVTPLTK